VPGSGVPPQLGLPARASRVTGDGLPDFALFRPNIDVDIVLGEQPADQLGRLAQFLFGNGRDFLRSLEQF